MNSNNLQRTKILSLLTAEDFIGRTSETDEILRHAKKTEQNFGLLLLSKPGNGVSELLWQVYDQLFYEQGEIIPFYFSFSKNDQTAEQVARRFLQTFLLQTVAFRRGDAKLLNASPEICELAELAVPEDGYWIDRLVAACDNNSKLKDERSFVLQALSAPLRANAHGARTVVLLDNFQNLENIEGEINLLDELKEIYQRSTVPFVFAGRRRYVLDAVQRGNAKLQNFDILHLNGLADSDTGLLIENLAENLEVKINEQTRDLIIHQFDGNPFFITSLFQTSYRKRQKLDSFQRVELVYVDSLLGGRTGKFYDTIFNQVAPDFETKKIILNLLGSKEEKKSMETWYKRLRLPENVFYKILRELQINEIVQLNSGIIELTEDKVLNDYIDSQYRLEIVGESRALVVANMLAESLIHAPQTMTHFYRRSSAIGLRELINAFNCQIIPKSLLDYSIFKEYYKGLEDNEVFENLELEAEKIKLPLIVYSANCSAFYPPINQFSEDERSAVALGFESGSYANENEIVWITAEIDSKLEASKELTEFWCDRLEMVALMCNFSNYKLWLVSPEGFSSDAWEVLVQCNAFGSSHRQVEFLIKSLKLENLTNEKLKANEYEMIVPMGDDTEMIAAHAVEEIARRHDFQPKAINQIKTALVEACINATEHSLSPDRKIYQKFTVEDDKIIITISNRGVKIPSQKVAESILQINPDEGRRGWGLKLMRTLMDEVKFEQIDDGTRISMVKYLKK